MILRLLAAALVLMQAQAPAQDIRPLVPGGALRDSLAGGDRRVFSIEVPAHTAARVLIEQDGIDVGYNLRRTGSTLPEHGLDMVAGVTGRELIAVPIADTPAAFTVTIFTALPRAARGDLTLSFELRPADDRARAVAAARRQHWDASEAAWIGDGAAFQRAQAGYAAAAAAAIAAGDLDQAAESTFQCARIHDNLGDTPGALEWQLQALALFRQIGQRDREARVLNRLGDLSRKLGEVTDAERYFEQALPIARDARDPVSIADILNNSGLLMLALGRYEEAIDQLQSAIPLAQEVNSANVEGALLNNSAGAYARLGLYDKSIETYQRAAVVVARMNLPRRSARNLYLMASAQFESGDRAAAQKSLAQSLALYDKALDRTGTAEAIGLDGLFHHASGDHDKAIELLARAQPLLQEVKSPLAEAQVLTAWAEVEAERGNHDVALPKIDEALRLTRAVANPFSEHKALYVRAVTLQKAGRIDDAIDSMAEAIDGVETTRGQIHRSELRTSYLATVRKYFDLYIDLLQQKGQVRAAFEASERGKARTLLEGLAESASKIQKGVDPALVRELRTVQAALNAKETYRSQVSGARAAAAEKDVARLLDRWNGLRAKIKTASPAYWALQKPDPVSVERVQTALLDTGSAFVEYHLGSKRSYAWVIDKQSISVEQLPAASAIDGIGRRYHELLSRETEALSPAEQDKLTRDIAALGRRLADIVWKPIEARVRGKRLLIAADGVLQYVPFAALPDAAGAPLVVAHEIVYVPSAAVLETIRRDSRPLRAAGPAAVFADPVFSKDDPRFAGARATGASESRAGENGYARLRFSRLEAEAIGAASNGAFTALDFSAAKQTLTSRDLRKYRILHFATHGSLNTEHPELSGLVFSLVDAAGKPIDGFLRLHEIYNLDLDADLVVLSACRTALGKEVHGEGLIGLTRGFMYAGASRVVSSVWNVDDRASARLMTGFYTAMLSKGLSPASALREAQLALLRDPRWANPHYWAAFGLQGEWK